MLNVQLNTRNNTLTKENYDNNITGKKVIFSGVTASSDNDSFRKTNKNKDNSKIKIFCLSMLGTFLAGTLYAIITKNNNISKLKNLAKHVEFKKSNSINDAIQFGKKNLGIKKYEGFQDKDIDTINWINEALFNINKKTNCESVIPKSIIYKNTGNDSVASAYWFGKRLVIDKDFIETIDSRINGLYNIILDAEKKHGERPITTNFKNEYNKIKSFNDKMTFYNWFCKSYMENNIEFNKNNINSFETIYHEIGHLNHYKKTGIIKSIKYGKTSEQLANPYNFKSEISKDLKEFLSSDEQQTAGLVSNYAKESPSEFIAETFAGLLSGEKYSDSVMALYKKYNGPIFNNK